MDSDDIITAQDALDCLLRTESTALSYYNVISNARGVEYLRSDVDKLRGYINRLSNCRDDTQQALRIVDEQAEDEGLWFFAVTAGEAYLQKELRRLHAVIELCREILTEVPSPVP